MSNGSILGERIKSLRENSKLTQGQVANYLNVDQSYIAKFEKGERNINVVLLDKLCYLFGCTEDYLIGESDEYIPLLFAFRSNSIQTDDLETIAVINKIALNLRTLDDLLKED